MIDLKVLDWTLHAQNQVSAPQSSGMRNGILNRKICAPTPDRLISTLSKKTNLNLHNFFHTATVEWAEWRYANQQPFSKAQYKSSNERNF